MFNIDIYGITLDRNGLEILLSMWEDKQGDFIEVNTSFRQRYNYILKHQHYFVEFNITVSLRIISTGILL
jgi:hypothetical protein